jgi:hypothetical protein
VWARGIGSLPISDSTWISFVRGGPNDRSDFGTPTNSRDTAQGYAAGEPSLAPPTSNVASEGITGFYSWQQTMLIPYVEAEGGYNLNVFAWLGISSWKEGSAGVDAWNTITLDSVSYSDGTSIDGPITFDSGFTIGIPEPGSLTLLTAALFVFPMARHRSLSSKCKFQDLHGVLKSKKY